MMSFILLVYFECANFQDIRQRMLLEVKTLSETRVRSHMNDDDKDDKAFQYEMESSSKSDEDSTLVYSGAGRRMRKNGFEIRKPQESHQGAFIHF